MLIQHNVQLQPYNSFRTKAVAKLYCEPQTTEELSEIIKSCRDQQKLVMGAGFNMFFTKDFDGLIIRPGMQYIRMLSESDDNIEIEAGAAIEWDKFVEYCVTAGYAGLENLSMIPGTVGAGPVQNIGAYGTEIGETIIQVKAVDLCSGEYRVFTNEECEFAYRDSIFKREHRFAITSVIFRLSKSFSYKEKYIDLGRELENVATPTLLQVREAIIRIRTRKLPDHNVLPNAGSFFKNPILTKEEKEHLQHKLADAPVYKAGDTEFKTSAAFLIDKAGYKGKRQGMVGTYEHHPLVIVNYGTDNGQDIVNFMNEVREEVLKLFGVNLEPEVWIF